MPDLSFEGQVVVVVGAGSELGRASASFFRSRGANLVVNAQNKSDVDSILSQSQGPGSKAVASYDPVMNGAAIIGTAIQSFGRIDALVYAAELVQDGDLETLSDTQWNETMDTNVNGVYKCCHAAWPEFRKQKHGRIVLATSLDGLYGCGGRPHYCASKLALLGFAETLAREGAKYNILVNAVAPITASSSSGYLMPRDLAPAIKPELLAPAVALLSHPSMVSESGSLFQLGGGHICKLRWERSEGLLLRADPISLTGGAILNQWSQVKNFKHPSYPIGPANFIELLDNAQKLPDSPQGPPIDFKGKVVLVTGGGAGLGRAYCLLFAKHGAKVVVNDLANPDGVVKEIKAAGGQAVGNKNSVEDGQAVVKTAIDTYGRIDVIINNAGILRDKAFVKMDDNLWNSVINTHLKGTFAVTRAAWPFFKKQKYGQVVNTTSTSGVYGNFGQSNYAAAKCGILGLSRGLAIDGAKYNIHVNTIAPNAGTAMTATIMPEELVQAFKPDYVAPMALLLCSDKCPDATGGLYEVGCGWQAQTRLQSSAGVVFPSNKQIQPEEILTQWDSIINFDSNSQYLTTVQEALNHMINNVKKACGAGGGSGGDSHSSGGYLEKIEKAKRAPSTEVRFEYDEKDVILYNLGVGARRTDLPLVYENHPEFHAVPTFGVIPAFNAMAGIDFGELVPNYNPMMLLHGEQFLEVRKHPIPTSGKLKCYPRLVEVVDKSKLACVVTAADVKDAETGEDVFYAESVIVLRGSGGFGGPSTGADRGASTAANVSPKRDPDVLLEASTHEDQAAIYRLCGDRNPLHIDPDFAKMGGFKTPILHGLCFMGVTARVIEANFGPLRNIRCRFASPVIPGQLLQLSIWKMSPKQLVFQVKNAQEGKDCIVGGGVELFDGTTKGKL